MIGQRILELKSELPPDVKLVAVSKYHTAEEILRAYDAGQRAFAESRPQELAEKARILPKDIEWHFIGHLQTNKIKLILPCVSLVQSVDSLHLLQELDRQAGATGKALECLLEVHISGEDSKQGFRPEEIQEIVGSRDRFRNVTLRGVMGMASFSDDESLVRKEFRLLKKVFSDVRAVGFDIISMGMSSDYRLAVEEGTNLVRIGTSIFGERKI